jgi:hypothetical protein
MLTKCFVKKVDGFVDKNEKRKKKEKRVKNKMMALHWVGQEIT